MSRHSLLFVLAAVVAVGCAPPALASSGAITNVHAVAGSSTVEATYTTNFDACTPSGYCGWFPHAYQVPASEPCRVDDTHITYVGSVHGTSGSETTVDTFYPASSGPIRLCLYAHQGDVDHLIAETVYTPAGATTPTPTPTPAPTPASPGTSVPNTGSITNIRKVNSTEWTATYHVTWGGCASTGCSWWAHAWQVEAGDSCSLDDSEVTWVGDDHAGPGKETASETFEPEFSGRIRLCLAVYQDGKNHVVAQKVFTGPAKTTSSTSTPSRPFVFSLARARTATRDALARRFGVKFLAGSGYSRSCKRRTALRVRCSVSWHYGVESYRGTVTVWVHARRSTHTHYSLRIVRRRPA